jgi:putative phosphoesterase
MKAPALLVVSDTHGNGEALTFLMKWAKRRAVDAFAFLGDGVSDIPRAMEGANFHPPAALVRGNGDWQTDIPLTGTIEFAGRTFYLCHGHTTHVKESYELLITQAKAVNADVALFGHTHTPFWDSMGGLLLLNPGSAGRPRNGALPSFATLECPPDAWFFVHHWSIQQDYLGGRSIHELNLHSMPQ